MKISVLYRQFRLHKWLPMYMDGALDKQLKEQVDDYLAESTDFSNHLEGIKEVRSALNEESSREIIVPEADFFWTKLQAHSDYSLNQPRLNSRLMQMGWALACTILLTASLFFIAREKQTYQSIQNVQASSVFDINGLIEAFHETDKRQQFYADQGAIPITQGDCCTVNCAGCCDTRMLDALQKHCNALKNRLLKSADGTCVILECSIKGNMITIIRQDENAVSTLKTKNPQKQEITGIVYERSLKNDVQITRWKSDSGKVTVLGDLSDTELEILIDASK